MSCTGILERNHLCKRIKLFC